MDSACCLDGYDFYTLSRLFNLFGLKPSALWLEYVTLALSVLLVAFMIAALNVSYVVNSKISVLIYSFSIFSKEKYLSKTRGKSYLTKIQQALHPYARELGAARRHAYQHRAAGLYTIYRLHKKLNGNVIYTESEEN